MGGQAGTGYQGRRTHALPRIASDKCFACFVAGNHVVHRRHKAIACAAGDQQLRCRWPGKVMQDLGARFQFDQASERLPIAAPARQ